MKEIKIITVNDGKEEVLHNNNFFFVREEKNAEKYLEEFLKDGWTITHCFADYNPAIQEEGVYSFYKGGICYDN